MLTLNTSQASQLSLFVAHIYHYSQDYDSVRFKQFCLEELKTLIEFDEAIWDVSSSSNDITPKLNHQITQNQLQFSARNSENNSQHTITFIRNNKQAAFSEIEIQMLTFIQPHFLEGYRLTLLTYFNKTSQLTNCAVAICDSDGLIIEAEEHFYTLFSEQIKDWDKQTLPLFFYEQEDHYIQRFNEILIHVTSNQNIFHIEAHVFEIDLSNLTDKEAQICLLLKQAFSNQKIADKLSVSSRTVENHLRNIYNKLDIGSRSNLVSVLNQTSTPHQSHF